MERDSDRSRGDALVIFGLNGDLGEKKLYPALAELTAAGRLGFPVVGVGRRSVGDDVLRSRFVSGAESAGLGQDPGSLWDAIDLQYVSGDVDDTDTFDELGRRLGSAERPVVYAALPPSLFGAVADGVADILPPATRLVVEKPFGDDEASARALHDRIAGRLGPDRLHIVDHFLAKVAIENLLTVRTSNVLFERLLDGGCVTGIEIEMSESGGVEGRESFYESVGAIDDVVQSHLLQLLALLTMRPPVDDTPAALRAARAELLGRIRPVPSDAVVLGQYDGYRDLDGVEADSVVETYVDLVTEIDDDRWRGVPVRIRTGKRLADDRTRATVTLGRTDGGDRVDGDGMPPNRVRFVVKPQARIELDLNVLDPDRDGLVETTATLCGPDGDGELSEYALMFDDALAGDPRRFASIDEVTAGWRVVSGIRRGADVSSYPPGSDGPTAEPPDPS